MRIWVSCVLTVFLFTGLLYSEGAARRTYLSPEQKTELDKIQTVRVHVLALTERGKVDGTTIQDIIKERLEELGYTVVTNGDVPFDVTLNVKCEEQKKWGGTTRAGGDADQVGAPARLWKGPACLFSYQLDGRDLGWYKEARTTFEDSGEAAKKANAPESGTYAIQQLAERIREFDFPIMIAAEWGHDTRLLELLKNPHTSNKRKLKILALLPQVQSHEALPILKDIIQDKELAEEAILALASAGSDAIPLLTEIFQNGTDTEIRAAAARALGEVGAHTGDPAITPPLLAYLKENLKNMKTSEDINFPILTEVVWGLGKLRNEKSIPPITELQTKVWLIYDTSKEMEELREATNWTYKQVDMDGQIQ
ncbi:MAG TPA: HEAT repeat domain-containing protein [Nitrospirales bacterium]|nr:HEAT repeat domain-containing protein [Nitrospirales bacterium]